MRGESFLSSMIVVLQKVRLHGRHIAPLGYSLDQKIAALLFSVLLILAGQNICCSFFVKNREEVRVLELILGWQASEYGFYPAIC